MYAAGATTAYGYFQGFNSAVVHCNQEEIVWVRVYLHEGTSLLGYRYSTFSGFLLHESQNKIKINVILLIILRREQLYLLQEFYPKAKGTSGSGTLT